VEHPGKLITFEGPDGAGKTTQIQMTARVLEESGYSVVKTREPGGTRLSEAIRQLLLDPCYNEMSAVTEALLYAAARAQIVGEVLLPALRERKVVLCDRFVDSSLAYQGYRRGQVSLDADPPAAAVQQHCHPNFSSPSPLSKIDVRGRKSDVENHQETLTLVPQHYLTSATFSSSFHLQLMPPGRHGHLLKSPSLIPACEVCHHILLDLLLN
jgi:energy-coupling factor transporter ATP-binding protein EcfA2